MTSLMHNCPGHCGRAVGMSRLACPNCWRRLPDPYQRAVTLAYARHRRNPADASLLRAHRSAVAAACNWYGRNLQRGA